MVAVPLWWVIVPLITGIVPTAFLLMFMFKENKDIMIPQFLFALPLVMFLVPQMILTVYLLNMGFNMLFTMLPLLTAIVPIVFLLMNVQHTRQYAPEGEVFKKARLLNLKNKFADVLMVWEGTNIIRFGCLEKDVKTGKIVYETQKYGLKIDPSKYNKMPTAKTADGVRVVCLSPLQITSANGEATTVVQEMIDYVRTEYPKFDHLSDLSLCTLLTTIGDDLEKDAHLYTNQSDPDLTEDEIVRMVKEIQESMTREIEIYPAHRILHFPTFFNVVNCAFNSPFLKDYELSVRALTLEAADKSAQENILKYGIVIAMVLMSGALAAILIHKFI